MSSSKASRPAWGLEYMADFFFSTYLMTSTCLVTISVRAWERPSKYEKTNIVIQIPNINAVFAILPEFLYVYTDCKHYGNHSPKKPIYFSVTQRHTYYPFQKTITAVFMFFHLDLLLFDVIIEQMMGSFIARTMMFCPYWKYAAGVIKGCVIGKVCKFSANSFISNF